MSGGDELPWVKAWREWTESASRGFKAGSGQAFAPDAAHRLGDAFQSFARAIQAMLKQSGGEDFARRFVEMLLSAAGQGGAVNDNDFLNAVLASAPRALLGVFPDAGAGQAWLQWSATGQSWAQEILALPSIGPQREWQEMLKAVQAAALNERHARSLIDEHYRLVTRAALLRLASALEDHTGPPIRTVRALYDLWIDQAEAAYFERVMSERYARDFAAWVDSGSALRLAVRKLGGRLSALFDAPGREEIDALLERQQAMQRELDALRAAHAQPRAEASPAAPERPPGRQSVARATSANGKKAAPARSKPAPANTMNNAAATPARSKPPRPRKAARGEFDIGHILDANK